MHITLAMEMYLNAAQTTRVVSAETINSFKTDGNNPYSNIEHIRVSFDWDQPVRHAPSDAPARLQFNVSCRQGACQTSPLR